MAVRYTFCVDGERFADQSCRLDAGWAPSLVTDRRLDEDGALETISDLVVDKPRKAFTL
jgi:glucuronate isomerase